MSKASKQTRKTRVDWSTAKIGGVTVKLARPLGKPKRNSAKAIREAVLAVHEAKAKM